MNKHLINTEFLFPSDFSLNTFVQLQAEEPFSESAVSFLNALAIELRNDPLSAGYTELITLAFFLRKANLLQLKKKYYPPYNTRVGRGIVFHISPSNTPVNFAYSLVSGILSGNLNIVRLPSRKFKQTDIILHAILALHKRPEFHPFSGRILLVRYDKADSATAFFSSICDARIIWGGNRAVEEIKKNRLPVNGIDVLFADKYSICIINSDTFVRENFPKTLAQGFYNDTFLFDQNACTSPHLVVWLGSNENVRESKKMFWANLFDLVQKRYDVKPYSGIDKLAAFYHQAIHLEGIKKTSMPDNQIWRIELKELTEDIDKYRSNCGYFAEYTANSLLDIRPVLSKKNLTIACYGIQKEEWIACGARLNMNLMDQIKPVGKTSEFSLFWNGYNLIETLSTSCL
ncbi:MAG: acyl-CoA reductase [Bacteroidia bacterium]